MAKKVYIVGVSPCFLETGKKEVLELFADKKNRIDAVFARKEDLSLLSWVRDQIAALNKSIVFENNGNIAHLNNASIFYDCKVKFIIDYIKGNLGKKNILILANGDPNFFGIGATILGELKENEKKFVEIYPAVSFMQAGFSKLKLSMSDALIISLHGRDLKNIYDALCSQKRRIGIYTDDVNTPYKIYTLLKEKGFLEEFEFYVLTDLCSKNEKIYKSFTKEILDDISSKKNIVILNSKSKKEANSNFKDELNNYVLRVLGIDDDKFIHTAGEPTKKEIRSVSLSFLGLKADSIIIDAGCGSGSISIEAAALAHKGMVYAIDKNELKIENLKKNMKKFGRPNIEPILGELPEAIKALEKTGQIDSIFIGGGSKDLNNILSESLCSLKDKGVVVINIVTINSLNNVLSFIKDYGLKQNNDSEIKYEIISVNVSRLKSIKEDSYFQALNQVYIVKIEKSVKFSNPKAKTQPRNLTFKIERNDGPVAAADKPMVKVRNKAIKTDYSKKTEDD